jgi:hypothetical protein
VSRMKWEGDGYGERQARAGHMGIGGIFNEGKQLMKGRGR